MIINITEYLANSLLTIFSMDLSYFEANIPISKDIVNIMIGVGWALLLGNLVFQAVKSMATGLGFEGEDPQLLFSRTFVMGFLLVASRQVCDIGLSITKTVIDLLQVPSVVQIPQFTEDMFSVPGDASWLLVIIIGVILVIQIVKLFFEIGERYVIVSVLTILSPLAFAMGGSKSTADIFKGWVRMFASMCLMMVLSVVFLKFILSAMSVVPSGVAVIPWTVFIVAIARTGRKADGLISRIGLNAASTGTPLGHSRIPGMLSYMVVRNMAGSIGKSAVAGKGSGRISGVPRSVFSSGSAGAAPARPPIGSSAAAASTAISSGSGSVPATAKAADTSSYKETSHAPASVTGRETSAADAAISKGTLGVSSTGKTPARPSVAHPHGTSSTDKPHMTKSDAGAYGAAATAKATVAKPSAERPIAASALSAKGDSPSSSSHSAHAMEKPSVSSSGHSVSDATTAASITAKPTADIKSTDKGKEIGSISDTASTKSCASPALVTKADIPLADKVKPAMSSTDRATVKTIATSRTESVKTVKGATTESTGTRPARPDMSVAETKATEKATKRSGDSEISLSASRPPNTYATGRTADTSLKAGNVVHDKSTPGGINVQQKALSHSSGHSSASAKGVQSRPEVRDIPNTIGVDSVAGSKIPVSNEAQTISTRSDDGISQTVHNKDVSAQNASGSSKASYRNNSTRPENKSARNEVSTGVGTSVKATAIASTTTRASGNSDTKIKDRLSHKPNDVSKPDKPTHKPNDVSKSDKPGVKPNHSTSGNLPDRKSAGRREEAKK